MVPRESAQGVIGVALGLIAIVGLVMSLLAPRVTQLDGAACLRDWFGVQDVDALPLGLRLESASRLASGEEVVRLTATGSELESVTFVRYPLTAADGQLEELFKRPSFGFDGGPGGSQGSRGRDGREDGFEKSDGADRERHEVSDWGDLDWGPYRAPFVCVRSTRTKSSAESEASESSASPEDSDVPKPSESLRLVIDSARVNLSQSDFACVLFAAWPELEHRCLPGDDSEPEREIDPNQLLPLLAELEPGAFRQQAEPAEPL